ncbi:hypothetical protein [Xanthomonas arboricola]|uniref:Uncharacterized protein n=1 Tax=Xanthomonas arboricola TaxID=56448 RepID=A0AB73H355_9XANT|nr:hypothetical protein [Xanthomonas arboricola]MBB5672341.1 hypothetical protein [Xanthomonas arboricola]
MTQPNPIDILSQGELLAARFYAFEHMMQVFLGLLAVSPGLVPAIDNVTDTLKQAPPMYEGSIGEAFKAAAIDQLEYWRQIAADYTAQLAKQTRQ